ncbi:hypothetical protein FDENT_7199 [Fusarium denticulatum]|uniref:Uncharacterized protein n=1 Tax=Fusarium denticulatum TaxID=48507 RepID=A0A8H5UC86_9HYPO|nr:hypothetical protein FDENT_7199 [Fusarium denticulatum]
MRQVFSCDFVTPYERLEDRDIVEREAMDIRWRLGHVFGDYFGRVAAVDVDYAAAHLVMVFAVFGLFGIGPLGLEPWC